MTHVLVFTGRTPEHVLLDALGQLHGAGAQVSLVINFDFRKQDIEIDPVLADVHQLETKMSAMNPSARFSSAHRQLWAKIRRDPWVRGRALAADVIVALDNGSVYAVWELAQRNPRPAAVIGLGPALRIIANDEPQAGPPINRVTSVAMGGRALLRDVRDISTIAAKRGVLGVVSPTAMRNRVIAAAWSKVIVAPGMPDRIRAKVAYRVHTSMIAAGRMNAASSDSVAMISNDRIKATLLYKSAAAEASSGDTTSMQAAVEAALAMADAAFEQKEFRAAANDVRRAGRLLFHRSVQLDSVSPLLDEPDIYLAGWRASAAVGTLTATNGRSTPAAPVPADRPMRLLIATGDDPSSLDEIIQRYDAMPGVELKFVNFADDPQLLALPDTLRMIEHLLSGSSSYGNKLTEAIGPLLEWADTVVVDRCDATAAILTMVDPGTARIVVRFHGDDTLGLWPHVTDFSRIDDLVFVSDHARDLASEVLDIDDDGPAAHVIPPPMDLHTYVAPKDADARFTLGLIGIGSVAKDPRWAFDVVRILRHSDPRYRLVLIGDETATASQAAAKYREIMQSDLAELEASGAVERLGYVADVPKALVDIGVILSSSTSESFHRALVEGTASGAVPVVRSWPAFDAKEHGARTLYPSEWVVESPKAAAERIIELTSSAETWRVAGAEAAAHALAMWDWSVVSREFDRLLLGEPRESD